MPLGRRSLDGTWRRTGQTAASRRSRSARTGARSGPKARSIPAAAIRRMRSKRACRWKPAFPPSRTKEERRSADVYGPDQIDRETTGRGRSANRTACGSGWNGAGAIRARRAFGDLMQGLLAIHGRFLIGVGPCCGAARASLRETTGIAIRFEKSFSRIGWMAVDRRKLATVAVRCCNQCRKREDDYDLGGTWPSGNIG